MRIKTRAFFTGDPEPYGKGLIYYPVVANRILYLCNGYFYFKISHQMGRQ